MLIQMSSQANPDQKGYQKKIPLELILDTLYLQIGSTINLALHQEAS